MKPSKERLKKFYQKWQEKDPVSLKRFIMEYSPYGDMTISAFEPYFIQTYHTILNKFLNDRHQIQTSDIKPKTVSRHVGIEIECFSHLDFASIQTLLQKYKLDNYVQIGRDGSIKPPAKHFAYELRILFKEVRLERLMKILSKFMREAQLDVNNSCGLHVHLDMRNRDFNVCYNRLYRFQDLLFGLVKPERRTNYAYCAYVIDRNMNQRKVAINRTAYNEHRTLEIRLHEGSVDGTQIFNWINLLIKIINTKNAQNIDVHHKTDVLAWANDDQDMRKYIDQNYQADWNRTLNIQKKVAQWMDNNRNPLGNI